MPTYEYKCAACGHEFEKDQKITDVPTKACPVCKQPAAKRQISRTHFLLKGKGWYATDYKDKKP